MRREMVMGVPIFSWRKNAKDDILLISVRMRALLPHL
jgi:hypothetical protein